MESPDPSLRETLQALRRSKVRQALFDDPPPPIRLGAFMVRNILGRGGMGTVLEAYDEQLERPVALKLLHGARRRTERIERLRREAKALAKLSHPNVVQVYGVSEIDGELFIEMELVRGQTLDTWQQQAHGWKRCVEVYLQAGHGLAAAHAAGLVHRDFKPGNCILDDDGRVRVLDFGLVRSIDPPWSESPPSPTEQTFPDEPITQPLMTQPGSRLGTLAYMSPEQRSGASVDARADQFSFCVALCEALYGHHPFGGRSVQTLMRAIEQGTLRPAPADRRVPARLRRALQRGLAPHPGQRWPSMSALLAELTRIVRPRYRWWLGFGLLGVGLTVAGTALWHESLVGRLCEGAPQQLAGVWDDARRSRVEAAIQSTEVPYADYTWASVEPRLDTYAQAWMNLYTDTCEATAVRHEQSTKLMDRAMACLDQRKHALSAVVDLLEQADAEVVERGVGLVASIPRLERCADMDALQAELAPPEDPRVATQVDRLRQRLAHVEVLRAAGKYRSSLDTVEPILAEAQRLGYLPLVAEAQLRRGTARQGAGQYTEAEQDLRRAYALSIEVEHRQIQRPAADALTLVVGNQQGRHAEGLVWNQTAMALARRESDETEIAQSLSSRGNVLISQGKYPQAQEHYQHALEIFERVLGPDHPRVGGTLNRLGATLSHQGRYHQALRHLERALAIRERVLGPDHPLLAYTLSNLGNVLDALGRHGQAQQSIERALTIREHALDPNHADVAKSHHHLASLMDRRGHFAAAQHHFEQALQRFEHSLGKEHPLTAHAMHSLGHTLLDQGRLEQAKEYLERALAIRQRRLGPDHSDVAHTLHSLANVSWHQGRYDRAQHRYQQALQIWENALGSNHHLLIYPLVGLARVALSKGLFEQARAHASRATELPAPAPDLTEIARARFLLAKASWPEPSLRLGARRQAEQARETFDDADDSDELAEIDRWIAEHPIRGRSAR